MIKVFIFVTGLIAVVPSRDGVQILFVDPGAAQHEAKYVLNTTLIEDDVKDKLKGVYNVETVAGSPSSLDDLAYSHMKDAAGDAVLRDECTAARALTDCKDTAQHALVASVLNLKGAWKVRAVDVLGDPAANAHSSGQFHIDARETSLVNYMEVTKRLSGRAAEAKVLWREPRKMYSALLFEAEMPDLASAPLLKESSDRTLCAETLGLGAGARCAVLSVANIRAMGKGPVQAENVDEDYQYLYDLMKTKTQQSYPTSGRYVPFVEVLDQFPRNRQESWPLVYLGLGGPPGDRCKGSIVTQ